MIDKTAVPVVGILYNVQGDFFNRAHPIFTFKLYVFVQILVSGIFSNKIGRPAIFRILVIIFTLNVQEIQNSVFLIGTPFLILQLFS